MGPLKQLALLAIFATSVYAEKKDGKSIGIFNIVKFENDVCNADNQQMNGTCYTAEECASRDGVASGSCAEGYGVCCIITVSCGGRTNENCTYLSQAASTTPNTDSDDLTRQCSYSICPRTSSVNRIRLDLMTFMIAPPTGPTALDGAAAGTDLMDFAVGQCTGDTFQVGNSPVICGANDGQHMIVDSDGSSCVTALFSFGLAAVNRRYTIHVIQYESTNEMGGPPGCLQFFTGATGLVQTFNWQTATTSVHLASQTYDVCVRKMIGMCVICWSPETSGVFDATGAAIAITGSFGVNNGANSGDGDAKSATGAGCPDAVAAEDSNDFVIIPSGKAPGNNNQEVLPGGELNTNAVVANAIGEDIFCGRYLAVDAAGAGADASVCSRVTPFKLGVRFDDHEATATGAAGEDGKEAKQEASGTIDGAVVNTLGTSGFSLGFQQFAC